MKFRSSTPRRSRSRLTGSLDGPSRTITVEPRRDADARAAARGSPRARARAAVEALAAGCAHALTAQADAGHRS